MHRGELPDGMPSEGCGGVENFTTYDNNSERAYAALDAWAAETTHAVINGLSPVERVAIYRAYVDAVYRFWREEYEVVLCRAKANVQAGLKRRGIWLGE